MMGKKYRELKVIMTEEVFREIEDFIGIKQAIGNAYGVADEFLIIFINAVNNGQSELSVEKKK